jgi:hypothetical protein
MGREVNFVPQRSGLVEVHESSAGALVTRSVAVRVLVDYGEWAAERFGDAGLPEAQRAADPDDDELVNEVEFLHGLDPLDGAVRSVPQSARVLSDGTVLVQIGFNPDAAGEWRVESCGDLSSWQTVEKEDYEIFGAEFRILMPSGDETGFYRLKLIESE